MSTSFVNRSGTSLEETRVFGDAHVSGEIHSQGDVEWHYPTMLNGWVNYGGEYIGARYAFISDSLICIQGLVKSGTANTIFELPREYYYDRSINCTVSNDIDGGTSARVDVTNEGVVTAISYTNNWVSLNMWLHYGKLE